MYATYVNVWFDQIYVDCITIIKRMYNFTFLHCEQRCLANSFHPSSCSATRVVCLTQRGALELRQTKNSILPINEYWLQQLPR